MKGRRTKVRLRDASIQKRLTFSMWLVAIVPITLIFVVVLWVLISTGIENTRRQSQMLLDKSVEEMDTAFLRAEDSIETLVTDINVQSAIRDYVNGSHKEQLDLRDFLRNRLASIPVVGMDTVNISIYIKEADKTYSRDMNDIELSDAYGEEDWFREIFERGYFLRMMEGHSVQDGRPVWILASSIISVHDGEMLGLFYMELDREKLLMPFEELVRGNGGAIFLEGKQVAAVDEMEGGSASLFSESSFLGEVEYRLSHEELFVEYRVACFCFLIGMVVIIFLIYMADKQLADWFSGRVIRLQEATRRIAAGDLDVVVKDDLKDEIGELAQSFNTMAGDMKRLIESEYLVKIESQQATLKALQSQINPHFVYNTLESISMMALVRDHYEIVDMAQAFSRMMRYSMEEESLVTVKEELENVQSYVTIQEIRFPNCFTIEYSIEEECMELKLPRLTAQPLVENAFRHGFEDAPDHKHIQLFIKRRGNYMRVVIFNDGTSIPKERLLQIRRFLEPSCVENPMDCYAMRNLSRRLRLLFGKGSRVMIRSKSGVGTVVTLWVPMAE